MDRIGIFGSLGVNIMVHRDDRYSMLGKILGSVVVDYARVCGPHTLSAARLTKHNASSSRTLGQLRRSGHLYGQLRITIYEEPSSICKVSSTKYQNISKCSVHLGS